MRAPIELELYDEGNEPVKKLSRVVIPWGVLKKAVRLGKKLGAVDETTLDEEALDEISDLIIQVFGEQSVTREELEKYADVGDMLSVMQAIVARGRGLIPNAPPAAK